MSARKENNYFGFNDPAESTDCRSEKNRIQPVDLATGPEFVSRWFRIK